MVGDGPNPTAYSHAGIQGLGIYVHRMAYFPVSESDDQVKNRYRVEVWSESIVNGWIEVEAEDECDARQQVMNMDKDDIEYCAEWGGCGDEHRIELGEDVEEIHVPSASDDLWKS